MATALRILGLPSSPSSQLGNLVVEVTDAEDDLFTEGTEEITLSLHTTQTCDVASWSVLTAEANPVSSMLGRASFSNVALKATVGTRYLQARSGSGLQSPCTAIETTAVPVWHAAAGNTHTCAILEGSGVTCWGQGDYGQLGDGALMDNRVPNLTTVDLKTAALPVQLAPGRDFTCVRLDDGTVKCWGRNDLGQLGLGDNQNRPAPDPVAVDLGEGPSAIQVVAGGYHVCALLEGGLIKCWGDNSHGQLGYGDTSPRNAPPVATVDLGGGHFSTSMAAGDLHTCAILDDGSLKCWGEGASGRLGTGNTSDAHAPPLLPVDLGGIAVSQVACGAEHTCVVLSSSQVLCWGEGGFQRLGLGSSTTDQYTPTAPVTLPPGAVPAQVVAGSRFSCARFEGSTFSCWGENRWGQLGQGYLATQADNPGMGDVLVSVTGSIQALTSGSDFACAYAPGQRMWCWGNGTHGSLGYHVVIPDQVGPTESLVSMPPGVMVAKVDISMEHTCARSTVGDLFCWGFNIQGEQGQGHFHTVTSIEAPVDIPGSAKVLDFELGNSQSCALLEDQTVRCWGTSGGVGFVATQPVTLVPVEPIRLTDGTTLLAKSITVGNSFACAIRLDDQTVCWGTNGSGNLGYGDTTTRSTPTTEVLDFGAGLYAVKLSACDFYGSRHVCALLSDQTVQCWGANNRGQLGTGDTTQRNSPPGIGVPLGAAVLDVDVDFEFSCALLEGGTVKCWGSNSEGRLGPNIVETQLPVPSDVPVDLGGRTAKGILAGNGHACAILLDGGLRCWGNSGFNNVDQPPGAVVQGRGGVQRTCVVDEVNRLYCWGITRDWALGLASLTYITKPGEPVPF